MKNSTQNEINLVKESTPLVYIPSSDMSDYYKIKAQVFTMIDELKREGKSDETILSMLGKTTDLSRDLIEFLYLIH